MTKSHEFKIFYTAKFFPGEYDLLDFKAEGSDDDRRSRRSISSSVASIEGFDIQTRKQRK